ncbi:MAG: type II toxin-antitoxin system VapB family antitoxin [Caldilineaceae bacterium]
MTIQITSPEVEQMAQELVAYTGETLPEAIEVAIRERLERQKKHTELVDDLAAQLMRIGQECAQLPVLDNRDPDEILGYDNQGLPRNGH